MKYFALIITILINQSCDLFFPDDYDVTDERPLIAYGKMIEDDQGRQIAREIFTMDIDGRNIKRITDKGAFSWLLNWSPDGQEILYEFSLNGSREIYKMRYDGEFKTRLTHNNVLERTAMYSPEGDNIAFSVRELYSDSAYIYIMSSDGQNEQKLTSAGIYEYVSDFSPDGSRIIFSSLIEYDSTHNAMDNWDIFIMDIDGSNRINLTNNDVAAVGPRFSPDGEEIVFTMGTQNIDDIYTMDIDGSNITNLTNNPGSQIAIQYSPEGRKILVSSARNEEHRKIYVMNADGSDQKKLTDFGKWQSGAHYSSDGDKIVFRSVDYDKNVSIWIMDADGKNQIMLLEKESFGFPRIQPQL
jgi:Tol biopolymer transport system component